MTSRPSLETKLPSQKKNTALSLAAATGFTAALFGVLATLTVVIQRFSEEESSTPFITEVGQALKQTPPKNKTVAPVHNPEFTKPIAPQRAQTTFHLPDQETPELIAPPTPKSVTFDSLVLDEVDTTNVFEEPKPEPSKKPSTPARDEASEKRKQAERLASLAKKITRQASVATRSMPHYPRSARRNGHQGRTVILVTVSINGTVHSPKIVKSSGHPSLDQSAVKAALKHRFTPALNGLGQPVAVQHQLPFSFKLTS